MKWILAIISATTLAAAPAADGGFPAEFGVGEAPRKSQKSEAGQHNLLDAARMPAMSDFDGDALRFSSEPALGGIGYVIELRAAGRVDVSWYKGHRRSGWSRTRHMWFQADPGQVLAVASTVDEMMAKGVAELKNRGDAVQVCLDGPGFLTERRKAGQLSWLRPFCPGANAKIAEYLVGWTFRQLGRSEIMTGE